jgi:hypothetical protein
MSRPATLWIAVALLFATAACSSNATPATTSVTRGSSGGAVMTVATTPVETAPVDSATADADRATVVSYTIQQAIKLGYQLDAACLAKVVAQLSGADAAVLAAGTENTAPDATSPVLSDAGTKLGDTVIDCAKSSTNTALVAKAVASVLASPGGGDLDKVCVQRIIAKLSDQQLQAVVNSATDSTDPQLQPIGASLFQCLPPSESLVP